MKILVFEFATLNKLEDSSITVEGNAMLQGLLEDLKKFKTYNLIPTGSNTIQSFNSQAIPMTGNLMEWISSNIKKYDGCIPIAPEENNILYNLTSLIEKQGVEVIGSTSDAVMKTTNKLDTYNILKNKVPIIKTEKVYFNDSIENYKKQINKFNTGLDKQSKVLKPVDGVSCAGVNVINSFNEFIIAKDHIKKHTKLPYFILQNYISGINVSVSLLSDGIEAIPLSLNFQDVTLKSGKIQYQGGIVPFKHALSDIAMETAKTAVKSIPGLKGYVGVDMILDNKNDEVYIVEINSRPTTPYVALRKLLNFNLGEAVINAVYGKLPTEIELNGQINFYKEDKTLRFSVLK
ncbi:MAG: ATP-grasp domain-containing protein [Methanobacterium sp.]|nr:ATP-grasp domain-containing protein [Methanobacterium sp.]